MPSESSQSEFGSNLNSTDDGGPHFLPIREYISFESILPNSTQWKNIRKNDLAKRYLVLISVLILFGCMIITHGVLAITHHRKLAQQQMLIDHYSKRPGQLSAQTDDVTCFRTVCALICPESSSLVDWYTISGLPYAYLPGVFQDSSTPYEFDQCYMAFWRGVSPSKRTFEQGEIRFSGKAVFDEEIECAQLVPREGPDKAIGVPHSCLTVSFHYYRPMNATKSTKKLPVLVHLGGDYMLWNRPRLVSVQKAEQLQVIYVTLGYRLGVFGFSDFNVPGYGPNHGVMDVRRGLHWIVDNIGRYGGDKRQITIYGDRAGATIALALLTAMKSNMSEG